MPKLSDPENFAGRVSYAALVISERRDCTRAFDSCFENDDGCAVSLALYRRAQAKPETTLARNMSWYLNPEKQAELATKYAHVTNLSGLARQLRADREAARQAFYAEQAEKQRQAAAKAVSLDACVIAFEPAIHDPLAGPTTALIDTAGNCNAMAEKMRAAFPDVEFWVGSASHADGLKVESKFRDAITAPPPPAYREDLTPAGPQLVIPGCERRPVDNGKPAQLSLFG